MLVVPSMVITVTVSRHLALRLFALEQARRRDAALLRLGNSLIGVSDDTRIRELARACTEEIVAATPGLRLITVDDHAPDVVVVERFGEFGKPTPTLPATVLPADRTLGEPQPPLDGGPLTTSVGRALHWLAVPVPDRPARWTFVGWRRVAPARGPQAPVRRP